MESWRRHLTTGATGTVLEVGVGSGLGLRHYRSDTTVIGVEPDLVMLERARRRARRAGARVLLVAADGQQLPFRAGTFDSAVMQLALCTIPDPRAALAEVRRALRPGAALHVLEHVRVDRPIIGRVQDWLTPLWRRMAGGCHLNRRTAQEVERGGFRITGIVRHAGGLFQEISACAPDPELPV